MEWLECRQLFAAFPTNFEQYELELLNRARANPPAEVTRLSGQVWGDDPTQVPGTAYPAQQTPSLNEGLPAGTITPDAKQPLAFNTNLIQAARDYSQTLLNNNAFTHTYNNTNPMSRMQAAGYTFSGSFGAGENLAVRASSGPLNIDTAISETLHNNLFIDSNEVGRGHRINMMYAPWKEIGIGLAQINTYTLFGPGLPNAVLTTQDFAYVTGNPFLTGVAYNDTVTNDNFYTPNEGLGGVTITATPTAGGSPFTTTTFSSGGYSLQVPAGTYTVTASGGGLPSAVTYTGVVVGSLNVKRDIKPLPAGMTATANASYTYLPTAKTLVVNAGTLTFSQDAGAAVPGLTVTATGAGTGLVFNNNEHLGGLTLSGGATATLAGVGANRTAANHRILVANALSVDAAGGSKLDLADNDLVLKGGGAAGLASIQSLVSAGYNKHAWNGNGIVSSTAAGKTSNALAYALNDGSVIKAKTTFGPNAEAVGSTDVLVKYTWEGDSNLDGQVSFDDYFYIDSKYPKNSGSTWVTGDFDYNAQTSFDDYFYIDSNYPRSTVI